MMDAPSKVSAGHHMQRCLTLLVWLLPTLPAAADDVVDYAKQIKPILKERCWSCHGALKQKAGLRLDTAVLMREGGDNGPVVVAKKPGESPLIERVLATEPAKRMPPPSEGEPLKAEQVALLKRWIEQGAGGPANEKAEEDPRKHWAFRKPARPAVPMVSDPAWRRNPIDAFIAAEHAKRGLTPQPLASPEQQLRRVYLDLIGLPPTRAELHEFLKDCAVAGSSTEYSVPSTEQVASSANRETGASTQYSVPSTQRAGPVGPGVTTQYSVLGTHAVPDAVWHKWVDRLLSSPHYGERWGRHWMDVWRYADWYGRRHVPDVWNSAPQVWRWRDWIVASLNADKGYDRMIQEMIAGDEIAPTDPAATVATGYIVRNWYALNPHHWRRDTIEHTSKAFLGLTLGCAHCHDHKYDPIAHEDYFRMWAFFEPIEVRQDRVPGEGDPGAFQKYEYSVLRKIAKLGAVRIYDDKMDAKTFVYVGGDERNKIKDKAPVQPAAFAFLGGDRVSIEPVQLPVGAWYPALQRFVVEEESKKRSKDWETARAALEQALEKANLVKHDDAAAWKSAHTALAAAEMRHGHAAAEMVAYRLRVTAERIRTNLQAGDERAAALAASKSERFAAWGAAQEHVLKSEQALAQAQQTANTADAKTKDAALKALKTAEQQAATAKKALEQAEKNRDAVSDKYAPLGPTFPKTSSGRRRALAQWLASVNNPLTARVAVNHIWLRHFDQALVDTVFDFGRNGKRPSHPELLDWLAVEFMEGGPDRKGWSMKHLHRLIVTSRTYRLQSAAGSNPSAAKDPDNRGYWRGNPHRLEAEAVRDSILAAAGELDRTLGGPTLENSEEPKSKRRSLYFTVHPEDAGHLKFLEIFDAPDPCDCYRRSDSIMPQQALALSNNELAVNQSRVLARKLTEQLGKDAGDDGFVAAAFEQMLTRRPTKEEAATCQEFLSKQRTLYSANKTAPAGGAAADPVLRARESLVRALFSHNDFVTLR